MVALRVVTNQYLGESRVKDLNMLFEIFAVFEIKLILSTLLNRAARCVSLSGCIAENRCAELLVDQNSSLVFRDAGMNGNDESVVDYPLRSRDLRRLLCTQCAVPSEHLFLERATMVKRQNVEGLIEAEGRHAISLDFR